MNWLSFRSNKRAARALATPARFMLGQQVNVRTGNGHGSNSPPYYVRGKLGVVEEVCASLTPSDRAPRAAPDLPMQSYRLRFPAREVWPELPGARGENLAVRISEEWLEA
jgi:hypothetical protein